MHLTRVVCITLLVVLGAIPSTRTTEVGDVPCVIESGHWDSTVTEASIPVVNIQRFHTMCYLRRLHKFWEVQDVRSPVPSQLKLLSRLAPLEILPCTHRIAELPFHPFNSAMSTISISMLAQKLVLLFGLFCIASALPTSPTPKHISNDLVAEHVARDSHDDVFRMERLSNCYSDENGQACGGQRGSGH